MSSGLATWRWLPSSARILEQPWNPLTTWLNPALFILGICLLSSEWSDVAVTGDDVSPARVIGDPGDGKCTEIPRFAKDII